jgi:hypothetical protein
MGQMSRREFIEAATAATVAALGVGRGLAEAPGPDANIPKLPWDQEISLRQAAQSTVMERAISSNDPTPFVPNIYHPPGLQTVGITNPALKAGLWGPAHQITLSMIKTDVQDRRVKWPRVVTLDEIKAGAFAPINRNDAQVPINSTRPVKGYLKPDGGRADPYSAGWHAYPFPCQKPVGQIILMLDDLKEGAVSKATQNCANGKVSFQLNKDSVRAEVEVVLSMVTNVFAIRMSTTGLLNPARLRLYRHQDQGHLRYMTAGGKFSP